MTVLITGDRGFIGGYVVQKFLKEGHRVIGIDNNWKYTPVTKSFDDDPMYKHFDYDAKDVDQLRQLLYEYDVEVVIAGAAIIGGISLFHELAYDLLAENERILASTFDAAISAYKFGKLKRIVVLSSSMVFENVDTYPTPEHAVYSCPPPMSTYGFQKLAVEYFAKGAYEQYGLPYVIARPFNCVGIGERRAKIDRDVRSGDIKLAMSHVVPDLIQKIHKGQDPLIILGEGNQIRHYTYGGDLADGIYTCAIHPRALLDDFNLSTRESTTVLQLAEKIWTRMKPGVPFRYETSEPFKYDVQKRMPDVTKAAHLLGYSANTSLDDILDEVVPWVIDAANKGLI